MQEPPTASLNGRDEGCAAARQALFAFLLIRRVAGGGPPHHVGRVEPVFFISGARQYLNYGSYMRGRRRVPRGAQAGGRAAQIAALVLRRARLTFDEFGMWLPRRQLLAARSVDAVVVVAALLGLASYAPQLKDFEERHVRAAIAIAICLVLFGLVLWDAGHRIGDVYGPRLRELESASSP